MCKRIFFRYLVVFTSRHKTCVSGQSVWADFTGLARVLGATSLRTRKGCIMALENFLQYYKLPSGNVIVYSQDEVVVISGSVREVAERLRYLLNRLRQRGLSPEILAGRKPE